MTRTVGVGAIGCGNVAMRSHLPAYLRRSDRVPERLAEVRALTGLAADRAFRDLAGLLALPDVGFVDICAPPRFHLATASAAAAGMVDASARADVRLGFVHNHLCFPDHLVPHDGVAERVTCPRCAGGASGSPVHGLRRNRQCRPRSYVLRCSE